MHPHLPISHQLFDERKDATSPAMVEVSHSKVKKVRKRFFFADFSLQGSGDEGVAGRPSRRDARHHQHPVGHAARHAGGRAQGGPRLERARRPHHRASTVHEHLQRAPQAASRERREQREPQVHRAGHALQLEGDPHPQVSH